MDVYVARRRLKFPNKTVQAGETVTHEDFATYNAFNAHIGCGRIERVDTEPSKSKPDPSVMKGKAKTARKRPSKKRRKGTKRGVVVQRKSKLVAKG